MRALDQEDCPLELIPELSGNKNPSCLRTAALDFLHLVPRLSSSTSQLCDVGQVTLPLWALVSLSLTRIAPASYAE